MVGASSSGFDATEPAYDAPPRFAGAGERRMHLRAYNNWASLLRGRELPSVADLDLSRDEDFGANSLLLQVVQPRRELIVRFVGERLRRPGEPGPGDRLPAAAGGTLVSQSADHAAKMLERRAPVQFSSEFTCPDGSAILCRGILMPLGYDPPAIDFIHAVINWKQAAGAAMTARLIDEVGGLSGPDRGGAFDSSPDPWAVGR
jgi:hypothetical protein